MTSYQKRALQAFRRVQAWLAAHPDFAQPAHPAHPQLVTATTTISVAAVAHHVATFDRVVSQLTLSGAEQETQDRAATGAVDEARQLRRELFAVQIRHVAVMAKAAIPDVVAMVVELRRPDRQIDTEGLIAAAEAMARVATQYQALLVQRGLPEDFIEQLQRVAAAFKAAVDSRGAALGLRHHAVEATREFVARGHRVIETLDVLVQRRYRDDSATIAEWKQVKRVVAARGRAFADEAAGEPEMSVIQPATTVVNSASSVIQPVTTVVNSASSVIPLPATVSEAAPSAIQPPAA